MSTGVILSRLVGFCTPAEQKKKCCCISATCKSTDRAKKNKEWEINAFTTMIKPNLEFNIGVYFTNIT